MRSLPALLKPSHRHKKKKKKTHIMPAASAPPSARPASPISSAVRAARKAAESSEKEMCMSLRAHAQHSISTLEEQLNKALLELQPIEKRLDEAERVLEQCAEKADRMVEDLMRRIVAKIQQGDGGRSDGCAEEEGKRC